MKKIRLASYAILTLLFLFFSLAPAQTFGQFVTTVQNPTLLSQYKQILVDAQNIIWGWGPLSSPANIFDMKLPALLTLLDSNPGSIRKASGAQVSITQGSGGTATLRTKITNLKNYNMGFLVAFQGGPPAPLVKIEMSLNGIRLAVNEALSIIKQTLVPINPPAGWNSGSGGNVVIPPAQTSTQNQSYLSQYANSFLGAQNIILGWGPLSNPTNIMDMQLVVLRDVLTSRPESIKTTNGTRVPETGSNGTASLRPIISNLIDNNPPGFITATLSFNEVRAKVNEALAYIGQPPIAIPSPNASLESPASVSTPAVSTPTTQSARARLVGVLQRVSTWALGFLVVVAVAMVVFAAFSYLTAGGNAERVKTANKMLLYAAVGLMVGLLAKVFVSLVSEIIGAPPVPAEFQDVQQFLNQ